MAIYFYNIKIPFTAREEDAVEKAAKIADIPQSEIKSGYVVKTSLDARRRDAISLVNTVCLELKDFKKEEYIAKKIKGVKLKRKEPLKLSHGIKPYKGRIVVAGFGPAGIFAALVLAKEGYRPLVLERGPSVDSRVQAVEKFWNEGILSKNANVQFGEGGAGTFSDGKLTTRINDPLCDEVISEFLKHGAPAEIAKKAKPHIGTDNLRGIIKSIREEIIRLGGEILFNTPLSGIKTKNGKLISIFAGSVEIQTELLVLAIGHSSRDTFSTLLKEGVDILPKPFSVGVRIEHLQKDIDKGLYGEYASNPLLPKGEYALSYREGDRCVYTFCMCPGGLVVPSSSDVGQVVTNGMSEYKRDRDNANSALVVSVSPKDFGNKPLDGVYFQKVLEEKAFLMGGKTYKAPAAAVCDFLNGRTGLSIGRVEPSYSLGVVPADFTSLFPESIISMLKVGIKKFGQKLPGFDSADAILTAPETRTSSPVRITRAENMVSTSIDGIYPCGEGAGYAGGIMSAATDGLRVAHSIIEQYSPESSDDKII